MIDSHEMAARPARPKRERGSALLVTLMILVGLSLLGLGFVAMSETEGAIAINERNTNQTLHVAEAGAKTVVEWFQDPEWALAQGLMPANTNAIKVVRKLSLEATPTTYVYDSYYKPTGMLFDKPFRTNDGKFYGHENNPDILINDRTAPAFLTQFNVALFNTDATPTTTAAECVGCDNDDGGRVTEIRIYAPPVDGGFTNAAPGWTTAAGIPAAQGYIYGGSRYGIATIKVTATKFNRGNCGPFTSGCTALAQRVVKAVIAEWPVPGPSGPLQSASNLTNAGNMHVFWGRSTSEQALNLTKTQSSVPWHDAYNIANFERGYDSKVFPLEPTSTDYKKKYAWLHELQGRSFNDPWWGARARGTVTGLAPATDAHPDDYDGGTITTAPNTGEPTRSVMFQLQTKSDGVDYREVLFPRIDYNFWKQVAIAAADQPSIKYLQHVDTDRFKDRNDCTQHFHEWVNTNATSTCHGGEKAPAGFYFFDTTDGTNPQNIVNPTNLTPEITLNGLTMQMKGFIYLNASTYKTTGIKGVTNWYNMPGEPYRDVGYREVEEDSTKAWWKNGKRVDESAICNWNTGVNCVQKGAGNGGWDYQNLAWSNGAAVKNEYFDVYVALNGSAITRSSADTNIDADSRYYVVPFSPGCAPGNNDCGTCNCSEPHEPYLNFNYPAGTDLTGTNPGVLPVTAEWSDPDDIGRPKKMLDATTPVTCTATSLPTECTSNAYDRDGRLVQISPVLDGVLYIEGNNKSTGNAIYFGSVLIRRDLNNSGTPYVFFDEKLIKEEWPPKSFNFPRVYISALETER